MLRRTFLKDGLTVAGVASAMAGAGPQALGFAAGEAADAKPLQEFGYGDVQLAPGRMQTQFEETQAVLLSLDEDALLRPWRLRAGLPAPGGPLGGWYDEVPLIKTPSGGESNAKSGPEPGRRRSAGTSSWDGSSSCATTLRR